MRARVLCIVVVVASLALSVSAAQAAVDMYFEGPPGEISLQGEANAQGYVNQIDVLDWSSAVTTPAGAIVKGITQAGKPNFQEFSFRKYLDR